MQRIANPSTPVRFRPEPPFSQGLGCCGSALNHTDPANVIAIAQTSSGQTIYPADPLVYLPGGTQGLILTLPVQMKSKSQIAGESPKSNHSPWPGKVAKKSKYPLVT